MNARKVILWDLIMLSLSTLSVQDGKKTNEYIKVKVHLSTRTSRPWSHELATRILAELITTNYIQKIK